MDQTKTLRFNLANVAKSLLEVQEKWYRKHMKGEPHPLKVAAEVYVVVLSVSHSYSSKAITEQATDSKLDKHVLWTSTIRTKPRERGHILQALKRNQKIRQQINLERQSQTAQIPKMLQRILRPIHRQEIRQNLNETNFSISHVSLHAFSQISNYNS
jgi:hypothetical protein